MHFLNSLNPASSRAESDFSTTSLLVKPDKVSEACMFSRSVAWAISSSSWKANPTSRAAKPQRCESLNFEASLPSISIVPLSGATKQESMFNRVDFPLPDSPTTAKSPVFGKSRSTRFSAIRLTPLFL